MKKIILAIAAVMMSITISAQVMGGGNGPQGGMPPQGSMGQRPDGPPPGGKPGVPPGKDSKKKKKKNVPQVYVNVPKMYAYAIGVLDGDSVIYTSDILELNHVQMTKKTKFLVNRQDYSGQFKTFLTDSLAQPNRTCAISFNRNRKALQTDFAKLKKFYAKRHQLVQVIDGSKFQFIVTNN